MQSGVVYSINLDIPASFGHHCTSIFQKSPPTLHRCIGIRMLPYAHPQHIKVIKHFTYMIWMWDAEWGGLQPQPWLYGITRATLVPNFPKISPPPAQMYRHKGAPIRPSTAYQGAQTLYIYMIWMYDAFYYGALEPPLWLKRQEIPLKNHFC